MRKSANLCLILTLIITVALAGCGGGGGNPPVNDPPVGDPPKHGTNYYLYVASDESDTVSAFSINPTNGALTSIPGSSVITGNSPSSVAADPSGKFLYVANSYSHDISFFSINAATGVLSQIQNNTFSTDSNPKKVIVDPTGNFVAVGCNYKLNIFSRDQTNGRLSNCVSFSFETGQELGTLSFDRTGQILYVGVSTGHIYVYAKNSESNTFTQVGSPCTTSTGPSSMAFNPTGDYLFISTSSTTAIPIYSVNVGGSLDTYTSLSIGAQSSSLIIDGNYLYISKFTGISVYSIANLDFPEIETINKEYFGTELYTLVFDPTKKFLYVTGWSSNFVWGFARNPADGKLTEISGSPLDNGAEISSIVTVKTLY